jgi:hypothetical protein
LVPKIEGTTPKKWKATLIKLIKLFQQKWDYGAMQFQNPKMKSLILKVFSNLTLNGN